MTTSMWVREWSHEPQWEPERDWSAGDKLLVWLLALIWILGPAWILALHDDYRPASYFDASAMAALPWDTAVIKVAPDWTVSVCQAFVHAGNRTTACRSVPALYPAEASGR